MDDLQSPPFSNIYSDTLSREKGRDQSKTIPTQDLLPNKISNGVEVTLLASGGPGFDSRSRRYNFKNWLSPAFKSQYGWYFDKAT